MTRIICITQCLSCVEIGTHAESIHVSCKRAHESVYRYDPKLNPSHSGVNTEVNVNVARERSAKGCGWVNGRDAKQWKDRFQINLRVPLRDCCRAFGQADRGRLRGSRLSRPERRRRLCLSLPVEDASDKFADYGLVCMVLQSFGSCVGLRALSAGCLRWCFGRLVVRHVSNEL